MELDALTKLLKDGEHALGMGKNRIAAQRLTKALSINSKCIAAHFYLALAELNMGHFQSAEDHARYVLKKEPRIPNAHLNLGVIKIQQGDDTSALRLYNKELKLYPECYEAHYNLGLMYLKRRKWKQVIYHLEKCWRNNHHGNNLKEYLALAAQKVKRFDLEEEIYTYELRRNGRSVWALNNLAANRSQAGQYAEAGALLRKALKLAPSDKMIERNLKYADDMAIRLYSP